MKILSKEFAVRFYALVFFHMVHGKWNRARGFCLDSRYDLGAKMFYKFEDIFGMIVIRDFDFEAFSWWKCIRLHLSLCLKERIVGFVQN